jgi:1,6-anhydro-N-acetylmuramate kinase
LDDVDGAADALVDAAADELPAAPEDALLAGGAEAGVPLLEELHAVASRPTPASRATRAARWRGREIELGFVT